MKKNTRLIVMVMGVLISTISCGNKSPNNISESVNMPYCGEFDYIQVYKDTKDPQKGTKYVCTGTQIKKEVSCTKDEDCGILGKCPTVCINPKYEAWFNENVVPCFPPNPIPENGLPITCACKNGFCKATIK